MSLLDKFNIPKEALIDQSVVMTQYAFINLINDAAKQTHQPFFGIELSKHFNFESVGIRGNLLDNAPTFVSIPIIFSFYNVSQNKGVNVDLEVTDDCLLHKTSYKFDDEIDCDIYRQISIGVAYKLYTQYANIKYKPIHIYFSKYYDDIGELTRFFDCPVTVGAEFDGIALPLDYMFNSPVEFKDGEYRQKSNFGHVFRDSPHLVTMLEKLIAIHLPIGLCDRELIAKGVGMHYKTLQDALKKHNTSYAEILKNFRDKEAKYLLTNSSLSIMQIATQLGYSETASFTRAFSKINKVSPIKWRRAYGD